jgi:hypothetical protein
MSVGLLVWQTIELELRVRGEGQVDGGEADQFPRGRCDNWPALYCLRRLPHLRIQEAKRQQSRRCASAAAYRSSINTTMLMLVP